MKEKIILAIKTKFPKANLSKARLNEISAKIEKKVIDDETKIDSSIDEFNEYVDILALAVQDDKLRTTSARLKEIEDGIKPKAADEPLVDDDAPAWAKALIEQNKKLNETVSAIQGEKNATTIRGKANEKLKDIPVSYWGKRSIPDTEDALDAFVAEVTEDYAGFTKDMTEKGLTVLSGAGNTRAAASGTGGNTGPEKINPSVKAYMEKVTATASKEAAKQN